MKNITFGWAFTALVVCSGSWTAMAQTPIVKQAVVDTSADTFVIDLAPEGAPNRTAYFMKLAGDQEYDGTAFHRVIK